MSANVSLRIFFSLALCIFVETHLYAQRTKTSHRAGEQVKAEKGLKDNRYFFYFINPSVTNFGTEEDKKIFREAILRDMISQMLYMRFLFHESYEEIRKAQKLLIDVYRNVLKRDIENARTLLNGIVPAVFESNDKESLLYLRLGYRDLNVAQIYLGMGDNITENLYSMRLYKYVEAMKTAKHGCRYAILGMIAVSESKKDKTVQTGISYPLSVLVKSIRDAIYEYERPHLTFNSIIDKIYEHVSKEQREKYLTIHFDSYFKTTFQKSFYDEIWEKAEVDTIEDYKQYKQMLD
ncbi:MAG: hypothetical protein N2316_07970 [Spirochaetes bacterium]|nr:hypothetical protein [Spirochaetota bacterium]